jgi:uncharacterized protein YicC (UPF0701 family)
MDGMVYCLLQQTSQPLTASETSMVYAFELPNGEKCQLELGQFDHYSNELRKFVSKFYSRGQNEELFIPVKMYKVSVKDLKIDLKLLKTVEVEPFARAMTAEDYTLEMEKLLKELPEEFGGYVSSEAYERGHSSGYEECYNIAQDIVSSLKGPIKKYGEGIRANLNAIVDEHLKAIGKKSY